MGTTFSNGQVASFDFKGPINGQRIFFFASSQPFTFCLKVFKLQARKDLKRLKCSKKKVYERGNTSLKSQKGLKSVQKE